MQFSNQSLVFCLCLLANVLGFNTVAMAAGFDLQTIPGTGTELIVDQSCVSGAALDKDGQPTADAIHACKRRIRTFDWGYWSQPKIVDGGVCRERDGSIVCLTIESKEHLRW